MLQDPIKPFTKQKINLQQSIIKVYRRRDRSNKTSMGKGAQEYVMHLSNNTCFLILIIALFSKFSPINSIVISIPIKNLK